MGLVNSILAGKPGQAKPKKTFVIVGGGIFGVSAALALMTTRPDAVVYLVDETSEVNPSSASHDKSKIIRDDYGQLLYLIMAIKAMDKWTSDPLYSRHFHKVGFIRAQPDTFSEDSLALRQKHGLPTSSRWMTPDEVRKTWPAFGTADLGNLDKVTFNPDYGYAEAAAALAAVRAETVAKGVNLITGTVKTLLFDDAGDCTGVKLNDGRELLGDAVLLSTGARTASLLVDSAPQRTELHAGDRIRATGAVSFTVKIEEHQKELLKNVPVFKSRVAGVMGEFMSVIDGEAKFNCDGAWTNNGQHAATGETMSLVPTDDKRSVWVPMDAANLPDEIKQRISNVTKGLFGNSLAGNEIKEVRFCWDAYTPSHDFIISDHPKCQNLYIATGGSFHGWKFFPVIGDYIVKLLEGELEEEYRKLWAWDRPADAPPANTTYELGQDLNEMK